MVGREGHAPPSAWSMATHGHASAGGRTRNAVGRPTAQAQGRRVQSAPRAQSAPLSHTSMRRAPPQAPLHCHGAGHAWPDALGTAAADGRGMGARRAHALHLPLVLCHVSLGTRGGRTGNVPRPPRVPTSHPGQPRPTWACPGARPPGAPAAASPPAPASRRRPPSPPQPAGRTALRERVDRCARHLPRAWSAQRARARARATPPASLLISHVCRRLRAR